MSISLLKMNRHGIMNADADARSLQRFLRLIALRKTYGINMINMPAMRRRQWPPASMLLQQMIII